MNKRSIEYMLTHDIDWFFTSHGVLYHCASNGGILPISCRLIKEINKVKTAVRSLPFINSFDEIVVNEQYLDAVVNQQVEIWQVLARDSEIENININRALIRDMYVSSFMDMACRGLVSMDRIVSSDSDVDMTDDDYYEEYCVIASPLKTLGFNDLAIEFPDITPRVEFNEDGDLFRVHIN